MEEKKGLIFDIQGYSVHDGPGLRTLCFLCGCHLRCQWCANPESWLDRQNLLFVKSRCVHKETECTKCTNACKLKAISFGTEGEPVLNRAICKGCNSFACTGVCYKEALKVCGKYYSAGELLKIFNRDRQFWGERGGVTFSGGEPMYQSQFLLQVLEKCKEDYIHTGIETSAHIDTDTFLKVMNYIDFAFIDVKHMNSDTHLKNTGVRNDLILNNIETLIRSGWAGRLILRIPVITDFNDTEENMEETASFMKSLDLFEINLLPFHRLGESKWHQLGKDYPYNEQRVPDDEKMKKLQAIFLDDRIACYVGSETAF
ncbi:MAG: 4-hydroxyphenylacetate decarboxylase activase [Thermincola sp.]|nr:4-hydroxyphenylacetate decarboxylase activase [Thermincola sp.]MDT3702517.1 4-hydroxyphenylacetate decarboxylase activase [Thermincola sp.]